jgi:hypothetical protein
MKEYPSDFGQRFSESYHNCPIGKVVKLCGCGNTFHGQLPDKYCSHICERRYKDDEPIIKLKLVQ